MGFDIYKIGAEASKEFEMTKEQTKKEVQYKMAQKMLKILLYKGIVTEVEYEKIDDLNIQTFSPQLAKVYV
ncbi:SHOCT domain-containing protein [Sedimentibacter sp.]|uniref:SHOCT domain-containing protein n=1 Tax=Sedimentibacter sp. TaxID=1960295 RepID=UPI0028A668FB|nr:SHOCT domain-containing protein [Sedimentibacter sp.]